MEKGKARAAKEAAVKAWYEGKNIISLYAFAFSLCKFCISYYFCK